MLVPVEYVAQIGSKKYETLAEAIEAATDGANTITLLKDIDLGNEYVNLNKAVTIDGQGYTITSAAAQAILLTGNGDVTITNTKVTASKGHGIQAGTDAATYSGALALNEGSVLTSAKRGIRVYKEDTGFAINVTASTIQSTMQDPETTYTTGDDAMGLSLGVTDDKGYNVTITNSVIKGFSYDINLVTSSNNLNVTMTGGATYGRAAVNTWGDNNNITLDGVEIHGINNQTGPTEGFACIVENNGSAGVAENNNYTIKDCIITGTLSQAAQTTEGSSATQYLMSLRGQNATVKVLGSTTYSCNAEGRGGFIDNESSLMANKLYFDDNTKATFANAFVEAKIAEEKEAVVNLYPVNFSPEVLYYWVTDSGNQGVYCKFAEPFTEGWLMDGEFIALQKDLTLTANIACALEEGSFTLTLGDYTIDAGEYSVSLNPGVTVNTDKKADIFSPAVEGYKVTCTATETGFAYTLEEAVYVAQYNNVKYETLQAALDAAEAADAENFVIDLLADAELDITAWDGTKNPLSIGTVNTQSITINGNNHKLTFNQKNSDWNNVATMNDAQTKLVLNNMTISNAGYDNSTWNSHDINFNCAVELNNVISDKALAFKNDATLKNVTISDDSGDIYAVWISPRGQKVDINGLTINCKRGIKIDDEYVDTPSNATLNIANATFNTTKKSAILVKNNGETTINAGEGINIENAAADTVNPIWVDDAKAEEFYKVTVTGANVVPEKKESDYVACLMKGEQRWGYYKGTDALSRTIAQVEEGWSIKLHQTTTEAVEVSKPLVITKNGFTADKVTAGEGFVREETDDEIIIKKKAEEVLVELIDGKPYPYPEGKECTSVTYKRTFGNTNMQAWYVPFDYTITAEDNENFTFYKISMIASAAEAGEVGNTETIYIYYTTLAEGSKLSANRPYFVKPKQSGSYEFTATGIDKVYPEDNSSRLNLRTTEYNYDFYGNLQSLVSTKEHEFLAMKSGEICWNTANAKLGSYRWYIKPTPRTDYSDYGNINFVIVENDGDTDQISTNALDNLEIEGIYTLGGVKVDNLVKGVNIIRYKNGQTKKLYIK